MDPLIRKVNNDDTIEVLNIGNQILLDKLCGYADDIVFIIKDIDISLKILFKTYHLFSKLSGIELNTTKTEILRIGDEHGEREYPLQWFFAKPSHGGFGQFLSHWCLYRNRYKLQRASSLKHVLISTTKKN